MAFFRESGTRGKGKDITISFKYDHRKQIDKMFNELSRGSINKIKRKALTKGSAIIRKEAKKKAKAALKSNTISKMITSKTWTKRSSVFARVYLSDKGVENRKIEMFDRELPFSVVAKILEYGSSARNIKPRYFMKKARITKEREANRAIGEEILKHFDKLEKTGKLRFKNG